MARQDGIDDDAIAGAEPGDARPDLLDDPAELVSLDGRELHAGVELAAVDVEVGAADAGALAPDDDLASADLGVGRGPDADVLVAVQDACLHGTSFGYL